MRLRMRLRVKASDGILHSATSVGHGLQARVAARAWRAHWRCTPPTVGVFALALTAGRSGATTARDFRTVGVPSGGVRLGTGRCNHAPT